MTPQQALEILNQACAQAPLTRSAHVQCQMAVEYLQKLIQENENAHKEEK